MCVYIAKKALDKSNRYHIFLLNVPACINAKLRSGLNTVLKDRETKSILIV